MDLVDLVLVKSFRQWRPKDPRSSNWIVRIAEPALAYEGAWTAHVFYAFEDGRERQKRWSEGFPGGRALRPSRPVSGRELAGGFDSRPPPIRGGPGP